MVGSSQTQPCQQGFPSTFSKMIPLYPCQAPAPDPALFFFIPLAAPHYVMYLLPHL